MVRTDSKTVTCPKCGKEVPTVRSLIGHVYYGTCCGKFLFEKENR
jgi:endogenous inhibitor of DNA gyrase (YacG/DUF329 family)